MNEIPAEWERVAIEAIAKQRRVDQLLQQSSKDEWFAKAVIDDLYPLIAAAERAKAAREIEERITACITCGKPHVSRVLEPAKWPDQGPMITWADPGDGHSYHPNVIDAEKVQTIIRAYADEQARP